MRLVFMRKFLFSSMTEEELTALAAVLGLECEVVPDILDRQRLMLCGNPPCQVVRRVRALTGTGDPQWDHMRYMLACSAEHQRAYTRQPP
jgi:hypothetical protein